MSSFIQQCPTLSPLRERHDERRGGIIRARFEVAELERIRIVQELKERANDEKREQMQMLMSECLRALRRALLEAARNPLHNRGERSSTQND
jgi:hypothetical protein